MLKIPLNFFFCFAWQFLPAFLVLLGSKDYTAIKPHLSIKFSKIVVVDKWLVYLYEHIVILILLYEWPIFWPTLRLLYTDFFFCFFNQSVALSGYFKPMLAMMLLWYSFNLVYWKVVEVVSMSYSIFCLETWGCQDSTQTAGLSVLVLMNFLPYHFLFIMSKSVWYLKMQFAKARVLNACWCTKLELNSLWWIYCCWCLGSLLLTTSWNAMQECSECICLWFECSGFRFIGQWCVSCHRLIYD